MKIFGILLTIIGACLLLGALAKVIHGTPGMDMSGKILHLAFGVPIAITGVILVLNTK